MPPYGNEEAPVPALYRKIDLSRLAGIAETVLRDRFGGIWASKSSSGEDLLNVGAVNPTALDRSAIVEPFGVASSSIQVVTIRYSHKELLALTAAAGRIAGAIKSGGTVMVGPRTDLNQVEVVVGADNVAVLHEIQNALPIGSVAATVRPGHLQAQPLTGSAELKQ